MRLYSYWRSTTSYRVRIALNLKGFDYDILPVDLVAGEQRERDYSALNPAKGVPTLVLDNGEVLTQSLAIIDYLETLRPDPALLPVNPLKRAQTMAAAHVIAMDVHPVNNLRVVQQLKSLGHDDAACRDWMVHWMHEGLEAFQKMIAPDAPFSFGTVPDLADICLVAQLYNGRRWGIDLNRFARLVEIEQNCLGLEAFQKAAPENQPDAN